MRKVIIVVHALITKLLQSYENCPGRTAADIAMLRQALKTVVRSVIIVRPCRVGAAALPARISAFFFKRHWNVQTGEYGEHVKMPSRCIVDLPDTCYPRRGDRDTRIRSNARQL